jgi:DNA-binding transcriptional ArsR family regulator
MSPVDFDQLRQFVRGLDVSRLTVCFDALSEPNRCLIFRVLIGGRAIGVGELAKIVGISDPLASQHLKTLREAGLVLREKKGKHVYYSMNRGNHMALALQQIVE